MHVFAFLLVCVQYGCVSESIMITHPQIRTQEEYCTVYVNILSPPQEDSFIPCLTILIMAQWPNDHRDLGLALLGDCGTVRDSVGE